MSSSSDLSPSTESSAESELSASSESASESESESKSESESESESASSPSDGSDSGETQGPVLNGHNGTANGHVDTDEHTRVGSQNSRIPEHQFPAEARNFSPADVVHALINGQLAALSLLAAESDLGGGPALDLAANMLSPYGSKPLFASAGIQQEESDVLKAFWTYLVTFPGAGSSNDPVCQMLLSLWLADVERPVFRRVKHADKYEKKRQKERRILVTHGTNGKSEIHKHKHQRNGVAAGETSGLELEDEAEAELNRMWLFWAVQPVAPTHALVLAVLPAVAWAYLLRAQQLSADVLDLAVEPGVLDAPFSNTGSDEPADLIGFEALLLAVYHDECRKREGAPRRWKPPVLEAISTYHTTEEASLQPATEVLARRAAAEAAAGRSVGSGGGSATGSLQIDDASEASHAMEADMMITVERPLPPLAEGVVSRADALLVASVGLGLSADVLFMLPPFCSVGFAAIAHAFATGRPQALLEEVGDHPSIPRVRDAVARIPIPLHTMRLLAAGLQRVLFRSSDYVFSYYQPGETHVSSHAGQTYAHCARSAAAALVVLYERASADMNIEATLLLAAILESSRGSSRVLAALRERSKLVIAAGKAVAAIEKERARKAGEEAYRQRKPDRAKKSDKKKRHHDKKSKRET